MKHISKNEKYNSSKTLQKCTGHRTLMQFCNLELGRSRIALIFDTPVNCRTVCVTVFSFSHAIMSKPKQRFQFNLIFRNSYLITKSFSSSRHRIRIRLNPLRK